MDPRTAPLSPGRVAALALAVGLLSALPYAGAGSFGFVNFDDDLYVYGNPAVLRGLSADGVAWAFTTFHAGNWHPLTWLSHMADVSLFGPAPGWYHRTSVLLHAASAALLFLALRRMTGAPWKSALAAALFGVHPLHVESVAWIAERKDVLSGLFFSLGLLAWAGYAERGGAARYAAAAACLALGLLAKPMLVTFPFLLLLLDYWPLGRTPWAPPAREGLPHAPPTPGRLLWEKVPLLLLCAASSAVTFAAQRSGGMVKPLSFLHPSERAANAVVSYAAYLGKALVPEGLGVLYPFPYGGIEAWKVVGAAILLAALTLLALLRRRASPWLPAGWFWYLGTLVPVIGLVQVGNQSMADRYAYLPLTGLFLAAAWEGERLLSFLPGGAGRKAAPLLGGAVLACLAAVATLQARHWADDVALFTHTLAVTEENGLVHNSLGVALYRRGRLLEAEPHFREAVRIRPDHADAHNNLGLTLVRTGRTEEGTAHMREAFRLQALLSRER